jgi:hypothetical protein
MLSLSSGIAVQSEDFVNSVFSTSDFWTWYFTLEPGGVTEEDIAAQLSAFRSDFDVREETIHFDVSGRKHSAVRRFVEFRFDCGDKYSIVIEYQPGLDGCYISLFLCNTRFNTKSQMGWWDLARWHPYCLRVEELDCLIEFWARREARWGSTDLTLLLLSPFVGLPDSDSCSELAARLKGSLKRLGVTIDPEHLLHVADGNYRWEKEPDLGWVFTSDEYCCYSLRNKAHADSDEGRFPFQEFAEMMADIQTQLSGV